MDLFNKKKLEDTERELFMANKKKLENTELELSEANKQIERQREQIKSLERKIKGGRVCDGYCQVCTHGVKEQYSMGFVQYTCLLDCKCKDFDGRK